MQNLHKKNLGLIKISRRIIQKRLDIISTKPWIVKMNIIMAKFHKTNADLLEGEKIRIKNLAARRKVSIFADTKLYWFDWDSHQLL
jgi:uncharacterized FlgJ-related protein